MPRVVIVSNRVADLRKKSQTGGLAVALADAMRERGGIWFGWSGETKEEAAPAVAETVGRVAAVSISLSRREVEEYYLGYANSVLWPLFHYRLDLVDHRPNFLNTYAAVNRRFATELVPYLEDDDLVWVQDYHLMPLAARLRELGCRNRIGFFLHIPFPPPDMLAATSNHREMVEWLLEFDLVGLQTSTDVGNLTRYLEDHMGLEEIAGAYQHGSRKVRVERFPIGIDPVGFAAMAREEPDDVAIDLMRRKLLGQRQIIGVDRLDYSKGLPERLRAYGRLLVQHPEYERVVSFLQIAPPTRENVDAYAEIRLELEALAGSINGRFAEFNWTPLRYIHRSVPREKLAPLLRASDVGFVTPLRDGMNLVAKEYVAAQDVQDPGVLVLSRFAGAAEELDTALLVNPYDVDEMSRRLHQALEMPLAERRRRHEDLLEKVMRQNATTWLESFLEVLERPDANQESGTANKVAAFRNK
jgi:trehalose 6-phosphate synthase